MSAQTVGTVPQGSRLPAALVLAGLDLTRHQVQPASGKGAAT